MAPLINKTELSQENIPVGTETPMDGPPRQRYPGQRPPGRYPSVRDPPRPSWTEILLERDPQDRDRDPPGQRPLQTETPCRQRPPYEQNHRQVQKHYLPQLRLRAVIKQPKRFQKYSASLHSINQLTRSNDYSVVF